MVYPYKIFSQIVDNLRDTGVNTNVVNISVNTYEFTTADTQYLKVGDFVELINADGFNKSGYLVKAVTATTFQVFAKDVGTLGAFGSWKNKSWYFEHKIFTDLSKDITVTLASNSQLKDRFPLVWLIPEFTEENGDLRFDLTIPTLKLVFANRSKIENTIDDSYVENYESIIDPYFERFLTEMQRHEQLFPPSTGFDYSFKNETKWDITKNKNRFSTVTDVKVVDFNDMNFFNANCK